MLLALMLPQAGYRIDKIYFWPPLLLSRGIIFILLLSLAKRTGFPARSEGTPVRPSPLRLIAEPNPKQTN